MSATVALINPKYPRNVGNVLRACSNFGAEALTWTPERIDHPDHWSKGQRLPREERMRLYEDVSVATAERNEIIDSFTVFGYTPVAIEIVPGSVPLPYFQHPGDALYVFGPEDGSLDKGILSCCHSFVTIPTTSCLNLAAAVNVVLYDRVAKLDTLYSPMFTRAYAEVEN